MKDDPAPPSAAEPPIFPEGVPVTMPDLPNELTVTTNQQFKALSDETRSRILGIIRHQPATAKQISDRLDIAPGTAGHHLQVLEAAGLAQVVARRQVRGIVAKYYARTARIFRYDIPSEASDGHSAAVEIATTTFNELRDVTAEYQRLYGGDPARMPPVTSACGFPHARITLERAKEFEQRLAALMDEFNAEPTDSDGMVYGLGLFLFPAPGYMQVHHASTPTTDPQPEA